MAQASCHIIVFVILLFVLISICHNALVLDQEYTILNYIKLSEYLRKLASHVGRKDVNKPCSILWLFTNDHMIGQ